MTDVRLLLLVLFAGILVFISYAYAYYQSDNSLLWAKIEKRYRMIYAISGMLAGLSLLYAMVYHIFLQVDKEDYKIFLCYLLIIVPASLWVPATFLGLRYPQYKWLSILTLLLTSLGGILLLVFTVKDGRKMDDKSKVAVLVALSIFVFHTTVLDLISWSPGYLKN